MLINHIHHFATDAESLVEADTFVKCDCCDVDSLAILVPVRRVQNYIDKGRRFVERVIELSFRRLL